MNAHRYRKGFGFVFFAVAGILLFGLVVMLLWNAILPEVLNTKPITYLQALGLLVLSKILFGGFRGGRWRDRRGYWNREMREKWAAMSPEEREKFRQEWRHRCGPWKNYSSQREGTATENPPQE